MKQYLLFVLLQFALFQTLSAQDSLYIRPFLNKQEFPNIDTVYYEKIQSKGRTLREGWKIEERNLPESKIMRIANIDKDVVSDHKVGVWKYYRKKGKISELDSIFYENGVRFGHEYSYDKSGNLRCRVVRFEKKEVVVKGIMTERKLEKELNELYTRYDYSKKGKLVRKLVWTEKKLTLDEKY